MNQLHRLFSSQVQDVVRTVLLCSHRLSITESTGRVFGGGGREGGGDEGGGGDGRFTTTGPPEIWLEILSFLPDWKSVAA